MVHKRPYDDEVVNAVSSKHHRQDLPRDETTPFNADNTSLHHFGEPSNQKGDVLFEDHENGRLEALKEGVEDTESDVPRSASLSYWATSSTTSDEDLPPEEMVHLPCFTGYNSFDQPVRPGMKPDDVYHYLFDYPPRKRVPIGPEHQAVIPAWGISTTDGDVDFHLGGICVLPHPEVLPASCDGEKVVNGRKVCNCVDQGSIRCVQQHIAETRDHMKRILGPDTFMELGFYDMGEVVAEKWTDEEEQLFEEVVYSNPASFGKNFWNDLSAVFPSRSKMEIVSYYFNVLMLRKRAEQNRFDPINVDSDNDEWQAVDDDGTEEGGVSDDDEDSGIESPVRSKDAMEFHQNELHSHEHEEDDDNVSDEARETDQDDFRELIGKSDTGIELSKKKSDDGMENDIQDGSCTSSDSGASASLRGAQTRTDGSSHEWHEYITDSCDGYLSCPKRDLDFLPTCRMIEEVFGDGDYDSKDNNR